jgi:hypothetical protein
LEYSLMWPSGVTCLPTHLFSLLDTNNFISEGGRGAWDFLCLRRESNFFHTSGRSKIFFIHTWGKRYMHTRPKKIIVCLWLPVTLWKRLGKGDHEFFVFVFCIGYIGHADVPRLCLLRKTNKIARIGTKL